MNLTTPTTTFGHAALRRHGGVGELATAAAQWAGQLWRKPLLLSSLFAAVALLTLFVHLLNTQVLRGEKLRQEQRAAASRPAARLALATAYQPSNELLVTRQPLVRP